VTILYLQTLKQNRMFTLWYYTTWVLNIIILCYLFDKVLKRSFPRLYLKHNRIKCLTLRSMASFIEYITKFIVYGTYCHIGNGIAGVTLARHIRKNQIQNYYCIFWNWVFFSRTALMYVFMGHMKFEHTILWKFFEKKNKSGSRISYYCKSGIKFC
jgi:hypothetical protein